MNKTSIPMLLAGGAFAAALTVTLGAQATQSTNQGVYTPDQATQGEAVYKEQCAACHGDNLEGSGPMPPLAGQDFLANWQGKTVGDLYEKTQTSMPATAPGTLTPEQTAQVIAFMLSKDMYPTGTMALSTKTDDLLKISIDAPGAAAAPAAGDAAGVAVAGMRTATQGVYTPAQATNGEAVYKEQCAACHGDNLEGSGPMPPLAGQDFLANWQGKTVGDLFEKTQTSMPATAPGTLTPEQATDLMAFILSAGKYPAGSAALSGTMDDLKKISIDVPK